MLKWSEIHAIRWIADGMKSGVASQSVVDTILEAVRAERPKLRYTSGAWRCCVASFPLPASTEAGARRCACHEDAAGRSGNWQTGGNR